LSQPEATGETADGGTAEKTGNGAAGETSSEAAGEASGETVGEDGSEPAGLPRNCFRLNYSKLLKYKITVGFFLFLKKVVWEG